MTISQRLYTAMHDRAAALRIETLSVGLGYTAVSTSDGGIGLAYTPLGDKQGCSVVAAHVEFEGGPAQALLEQLNSANPILRCMALALVNALNHGRAMTFDEDRSNAILLDWLEIGNGTRVAMAGYFGPLMEKLYKRGAQVEVSDTGKTIGETEAFNAKLGQWAQALILTSTSILNNTADALLANVGSGVRGAMLGPSTPLVPEAFEKLPIHILAGSVPVDAEATFRAVRHGKGTPALIKFARKAYVKVNP